MTRFLLDTHIALIGLARPEDLPVRIKEQMDAGVVTLSVLSYWEVSLKSMKGKLDVGDPRTWWTEALNRYMATALPLRAEHISALHTLPAIHHDPFDRALIGQAIAEELTLVTLDAKIPEYGLHGLQVLS